MVRSNEDVLWLGGRLTQEYMVDAYAKIEGERLRWVRDNQAHLRAHLYQGLMEHAVESEPAPSGRMIILQPSFTGGPRYMQKLYQSAMAIVRKLGKPDLFITMTCNSNWPESQRAQDRPDLCARVFRLKLKRFMEVMVEKKTMGHVKARVAVVEFQKRGLRQAHTLWILDNQNKPRDVADINAFVNAELPDEQDEQLFDTITSTMLHGPCGDHKGSFVRGNGCTNLTCI
ncbi:TPA: hypothetical protein N0F65_008581 [Lagenidium giganteum]|uniref:Helitron helicase-like domain-containing protein n=1 Tax=Lagenidium giganteum TaxID=4803 RepID=A0AAV2Z2P6_9STRA|nr:TPA: hypothetical protein N0F65_008581 [Lagenidium giganteum]